MSWSGRSNKEVFHHFANRVSASGQNSSRSVYYENDRIYSYGPHFCMGRHLGGNRVILSTRTQSATTSAHQASLRNAVNHLLRLYCDDAGASASVNRNAASGSITALLAQSKLPRKRPETRLSLQSEALDEIEVFNNYLAALPEAERTVEPLAIEMFEKDAAALAISMEEDRIKSAAANKERNRLKALSEENRLKEALVRREEWKRHEVSYCPNHVPVALRLQNTTPLKNIETSKGATIPISHAQRLWPLILSSKVSNTPYNFPTSVGVYKLSEIRADGSIVVGCHDIPFSELEDMAKQLGLT